MARYHAADPEKTVPLYAGYASLIDFLWIQQTVERTSPTDSDARVCHPVFNPRPDEVSVTANVTRRMPTAIRTFRVSSNRFVVGGAYSGYKPLPGIPAANITACLFYPVTKLINLIA